MTSLGTVHGKAPMRPEDLSEKWLSRVLGDPASGRTAAVSGFQVEEIGAGKGQASRVVRIRLEYENDSAEGPATLIGKFPSGSDATLELARLFRLYEREVGFYSTVGEEAGLPVPELHYSEFDNESGQFVLLIEDVRDAIAGDLAGGCSLDTAWMLVEAIAEMHANWWESPLLDRLAWLPAPNYVSAIEHDDPTARDPWGRFLARTRGQLPPAIKVLCDRLRADQSVLDRLAAPPVTLVHGDLRINNVMLSDRDGGGVRAVLDWQTAVRGRGPMDIASLFTSSLQPDDRRVAEAELIPAYHQRLLRLGVRDYHFDECWRDYRLAVANQFSQVVFLSSVLDLEGQLEEGVSAATGLRLAAALVELDVAELLAERRPWRRWLARAARAPRKLLTRS
jgi:hypothetical protein